MEQQEAWALKAQREQAMQGCIGWLEASLKGSAGAAHKYTTCLLKPSGPREFEIRGDQVIVEPLKLIEAKAENWKVYWNPRQGEPEVAKHWMQLLKSVARGQLDDYDMASFDTC